MTQDLQTLNLTMKSIDDCFREGRWYMSKQRLGGNHLGVLNQAVIEAIRPYGTDTPHLTGILRDRQ